MVECSERGGRQLGMKLVWHGHDRHVCYRSQAWYDVIERRVWVCTDALEGKGKPLRWLEVAEPVDDGVPERGIAARHVRLLRQHVRGGV